MKNKAPLSPSLRIENTVYISGQVGINPQTSKLSKQKTLLTNILLQSKAIMHITLAFRCFSIHEMRKGSKKCESREPL